MSGDRYSRSCLHATSSRAHPAPARRSDALRSLGDPPSLIVRRQADRDPSRRQVLSSVEQPEMSKRAAILLLVHHPLSHLNQTTVGSFDFLQYLLCVWILFALCALMRTICSFDVLTNTRSHHHLLQHPTLLICLYAAQSSSISRLDEPAWSALTQRREIDRG
jgi:hypothetical protein